MTTRLVQAGRLDQRDMVVVYNLAAFLDPALRQALGSRPVIVNVTCDPFTRAYAQVGQGKLASIEELDIWAKQEAGNFALRHVVLVGFSEGCQGIRAQLVAGAAPSGVVLVDGAHSGWPNARPDFEITPYRKAFDRACAGNGLFVGTHSGLVYVETLLKPYASTKTTLERITRWTLPVPDPSEEPIVRSEGNAHVLSYGILDKASAAEYSTDTWRASHIKQARHVLPFVLKKYVRPNLSSYWGEEEETTAPIGPVILPKTLGERCVEWCLSHLGHTEQPPGSNDSPLIRSWLAPCVRGDGPDAYELGLSKVNWCSAFQCAAMHAQLATGEALPHGYRAGVVELVEDTSLGNDGLIRYAGKYRPVGLVRAGEWAPEAGDLAIWDRSNPAKPQSSWWRHVERVVKYDADAGIFTAVGGNEGHAVRVDQNHIGAARLLGFIEYPRREVTTGLPVNLTDQERQQIKASRDLFWQEFLDAQQGFR